MNHMDFDIVIGIVQPILTVVITTLVTFVVIWIGLKFCSPAVRRKLSAKIFTFDGMLWIGSLGSMNVSVQNNGAHLGAGIVGYFAAFTIEFLTLAFLAVIPKAPNKKAVFTLYLFIGIFSLWTFYANYTQVGAIHPILLFSTVKIDLERLSRSFMPIANIMIAIVKNMLSRRVDSNGLADEVLVKQEIAWTHYLDKQLGILARQLKKLQNQLTVQARIYFWCSPSTANQIYANWHNKRTEIRIQIKEINNDRNSIITELKLLKNAYEQGQKLKRLDKLELERKIRENEPSLLETLVKFRDAFFRKNARVSEVKMLGKVDSKDAKKFDQTLPTSEIIFYPELSPEIPAFSDGNEFIFSEFLPEKTSIFTPETDWGIRDLAVAQQDSGEIAILNNENEQANDTGPLAKPTQTSTGQFQAFTRLTKYNKEEIIELDELKALWSRVDSRRKHVNEAIDAGLIEHKGSGYTKKSVAAWLDSLKSEMQAKIQKVEA